MSESIIPASAMNSTPTSDQIADQLYITKTRLALTSKLKKRYSACQIVITSEYEHPLRLDHAIITNGVQGDIAAQDIHTSTSWSALGCIGLIVGFLFISIPVFFIIYHNNRKAEAEGLKFNNQVPPMELKKGQTNSFVALVPVSQIPQVMLNFKDPHTAQYVRINSF